jgi:hypothetical protein
MISDRRRELICERVGRERPVSARMIDGLPGQLIVGRVSSA